MGEGQGSWETEQGGQEKEGGSVNKAGPIHPVCVDMHVTGNWARQLI